MGYNGPNPNKLVGGALCRPLVAQLMRHNEGDILVVVSTGNDMWWEHGRTTSVQECVNGVNLQQVCLHLTTCWTNSSDHIRKKLNINDLITNVQYFSCNVVISCYISVFTVYLIPELSIFTIL